MILKENGIWTYPDGREICDLRSPQGRKAYRDRIKQAGERQGWICCLHGIAPMCTGKMDYQYGKGLLAVTLEHESGRGMGGSRRDDRMELDGRWHNGAAHMVCNSWKSSRRIDYNSALQRGLKPVVPERKP